MEFVFGRTGNRETLCTIGSTHTDYAGWCETVRVTDLDRTTDSFWVKCKLKSDEDVGGACYDWYEIKDHYRVVEHGDRVKALEEQAASIENAMCDTDAENEERLAEIELALCELDERG